MNHIKINPKTGETRKIFVVGYDGGYSNWMQAESVKKMEDADLVLFTGGEDISPSLYNQPEHRTTSANPIRDRFEVEAYRKAMKLNKHKVGICRGHQFLCAMSGGILVQHQANPAMYHGIETHDGQEIVITSLHHQAAYPWRMNKGDYKVLAWANNHSPYHLGGKNEELKPYQDKEVEIAYFPKTRSYGIQGHPEMMYGESHPEIDKTISYLQNQLDLFLADAL